MKITKNRWLGYTLLLIWSLSATAAEKVDPYVETAEAIAQGFTERDTSTFDQAIDADAIIEAALDPLVLDPTFKWSFSMGLKKALNTQVGEKFVSAMPEDAYAKILRVKQDGVITKALLRVDMGDDGTSYSDLYLKRDDKNQVRIIDWFDYSSGQHYSESLGQIANLASPTPTVVGKIYDLVTDNKKTQDAVLKMFDANKKGDYAKTVELFLTSDGEMIKSRVLNIIAIRAAQQSGQDELYEKTLAVLDKYHGQDPALTFMLVDYHFMTGNYDRVVNSIKYLEKSFGVEDAALKELVANTQMEAGNMEAAIDVAVRGIELEPEYEGNYWSLLTAQLLSRSFDGAVATARVLEEYFGYDLGPDSISGNELYNELLQSEEYQSWRKQGI